MPVPLAPHVTLADDERSQLESLVRAHSTPQALVLRCRVIPAGCGAGSPLSPTRGPGAALSPPYGGPLAQSLSGAGFQWPARCAAPRSATALFPPQRVWR